MSSAWGTEQTKFFYELTPDRILEAVEQIGFQCTGRVLQLNSMENRVYEVEIEPEDPDAVHTPSDTFKIVKFYRPSRWSKEQIAEEHQFLFDLTAVDIPVIAPIRDKNGDSIFTDESTSMLYSISPKMGGRNPQELSDPQLEQIGRLMARMHTVGASKPFKHRIQITPAIYGIDNLEYLLKEDLISTHARNSFETLARQLISTCTPWFEGIQTQRIHGDAHLGNLLWNDNGPFWVDFDDNVTGPPVQDLWLMTPGRDPESIRQRDLIVQGYQQMRDFDRRTLRLIEPLRGLRMIHFVAWIARRWEDKAFKQAFPDFGSDRYWADQLEGLRDIISVIQNL